MWNNDATINVLKGENQKYLDNCHKARIISYMEMIYFYSSKYIPFLSIHLFARSFNFFMPSRKAIFKINILILKLQNNCRCVNGSYFVILQ